MRGGFLVDACSHSFSFLRVWAHAGVCILLLVIVNAAPK